MPTITKKLFEEYEQLRHDRDSGRILTPTGLRLMSEGLKKAPEATGKYFLEVLACFQATEKR